MYRDNYTRQRGRGSRRYNNNRYNNNNNRYYNDREMICNKCGKSGHVARDHCFRCGQYGHWAKECNSRSTNTGNTCTKCGQYGHVARDHCFTCGAYGHWAKDCTNNIKTNNNNNINLPAMRNGNSSTKNNVNLMDENDKLCLAISGYAHPIYLPTEVHETIRQFAWNNFASNSIERIKTAYDFASVIRKYINAECNICPYSKNKDFNLLHYVYVRGGALRDSFLLREINDIDMVIDIYELSTKYIQHLIKYHSKIEQQKDCPCIYWQRYKNINYENYSGYYSDNMGPIASTLRGLSRRRGVNQVLLSEDENVNKILALQEYIITADYLLNSQFIANIVEAQVDSKNINVSSSFSNHHWTVVFNNNSNNNRVQSNNVSFDIVDGFGNSYGRFRTFKEYGNLHGLSHQEIQKVVVDIDAFDKQFVKLSKNVDNNCQKNQQNKLRSRAKKIFIPIYPFPICMSHYDFTINMAHIDLQNILKRRPNINYNGMRKSNRDLYIDYNWENKIKLKQNDIGNTLINEYNIIAINDMKNKTINTPDINFINEWTADYYFWRLTKLAAKFIDKIHHKIWKIDAKLLQHTKRLYSKWCNNETICKDDRKRRKFVNKFLKWNIESDADVINRFKVFRYIAFENNLKRMMKTYPFNLNQTINEVMQDRRDTYEYTDTMVRCFIDFNYPYRDVHGTLHYKQPNNNQNNNNNYHQNRANGNRATQNNNYQNRRNHNRTSNGRVRAAPSNGNNTPTWPVLTQNNMDSNRQQGLSKSKRRKLRNKNRYQKNQY